MRKKIGVLHAHHSNIAPIEQALADMDVDLLHFVDPGLMCRVTSDFAFSDADAGAWVKRQVEWMAAAQVDGILLTCTTYTALLREEGLDVTVPIVKIDEPFFEVICRKEEPQLLLFSNPATVEGTMDRLSRYARRAGKTPQVETRLIDQAFSLVMRGKKEAAHRVTVDYLDNLLESPADRSKPISVAQLSLFEAARDAGSRHGISIGEPLSPLAVYLKRMLTSKA